MCYNTPGAHTIQQQQPPAPDAHAQIATTLKNLPTKPGVYIMKDQTGKVTSVGKAISLRNRVRSYFQSPDGQPMKTRRLVSMIVSEVRLSRLRASGAKPCACR